MLGIVYTVGFLFTYGLVRVRNDRSASELMASLLCATLWPVFLPVRLGAELKALLSRHA